MSDTSHLDALSTIAIDSLSRLDYLNVIFTLGSIPAQPLITK